MCIHRRKTKLVTAQFNADNESAYAACDLPIYLKYLSPYLTLLKVLLDKCIGSSYYYRRNCFVI